MSVALAEKEPCPNRKHPVTYLKELQIKPKNEFKKFVDFLSWAELDEFLDVIWQARSISIILILVLISLEFAALQLAPR